MSENQEEKKYSKEEIEEIIEKTRKEIDKAVELSIIASGMCEDATEAGAITEIVSKTVLDGFCGLLKKNIGIFPKNELKRQVNILRLIDELFK